MRSPFILSFVFSLMRIYKIKTFFYFQDNYNVIHIASMFSREDVVKLLLNKRGVDPYSTGGVSINNLLFFLNL